MMNNYIRGEDLSVFMQLGPVFALLAIWSIFWTGLALWHSAKQHQPYWFVAFLFIHTAGILEIIYLFGILKLKFADLLKK